MRFLLIFLLLYSAPLHAKDIVIMLHGIARSSSHMEPLAQAVEDAGFEVLNITYPSTDYNLRTLARWVHHEHLQHIAPERKVHFVGYSMGGLLTRTILNHHRPENLGRVLFLATPHKGSEVADWWQDIKAYQLIYGVAGQQLITDESVREGLFGAVDYEAGTIIGTATIDPFSSYIIPEDDDGKVSVLSAQLDGVKDSVMVDASHTFFPSNDEVQRQTVHFLKFGEFAD